MLTPHFESLFEVSVKSYPSSPTVVERSRIQLGGVGADKLEYSRCKDKDFLVSNKKPICIPGLSIVNPFDLLLYAGAPPPRKSVVSNKHWTFRQLDRCLFQALSLELRPNHSKSGIIKAPYLLVARAVSWSVLAYNHCFEKEKGNTDLAQLPK